MVNDKFSRSKLIDFSYTRATASNCLALRVQAMRDDLTKGGVYEESTVSILARALAVTSGSGIMITSRFTKE
jgi:hypothetical protein